MKRSFVIGTTLLILLIPVPAALALVDAVRTRQVLSAGGALVSNGGITIASTVGQPIAGSGAAGGIMLGHGFWGPHSGFNSVYLPVVCKTYYCGFETGDFARWTHGGELSQSVQSKIVYEGKYAALLGSPDYPCGNGVPVGEAWMKQTFNVASCSNLLLSFKYRIFSYDRLKDTQWDSFDVYINDTRVLTDGNTQWPQASCARETWDSGWKDFVHDLGTYSGEITVSFHNVSRVDNWYNTWTYVDQIMIACEP